MANDGHQIAVAECLDTQDAKTAIGIVEGNLLDCAAEKFVWAASALVDHRLGRLRCLQSHVVLRQTFPQPIELLLEACQTSLLVE